MKKTVNLLFFLLIAFLLFACRHSAVISNIEDEFVEEKINKENANYEYQAGDVFTEVVTFKYDSASNFSDGLAKVELNDKRGFIDKSGKEAIPLIYDFANFFSEGLASVYLNGKCGFIDKNGKEVIPFIYDSANSFQEGLACVKLNGKWGFIDKSGKEVTPFKYDEAFSYFDGFACVSINGKYGFIDKSGKEIIPFIYDFAYYFSDGFAIVTLNGKKGFIDKNGKEVILSKYDTINDFSDGLACVKLNGKWGFIDKSGKEVIPLIYDYADSFHDGLASVELNGKCGFIDKSGKEVIPLIYDEVHSFSDGFASVYLNGKWGFIDKSGKEVIPLEYEDGTSFHIVEGLVSVRLNGKQGCIDKNGNEVIPFKYGFISDFSEGFAFAHLNGKVGFITYLPNWFKNNNENIKYKDSHFYINDKIQKNKWVYYKIHYYHVDKNGNIDINKWIEDRYVGPDGKMYKSQKTPDGKWVGEDGYVVEDLTKDLNDSTLIKSIEPDSWYKTQSGLWYYFENDRTTTKKGWFTDERDTQTYYFDPNTGIMAVGWTTINGSQYYFNESHDNEKNWYETGDGFYESYGKKTKAYGSLYKNEDTPDGYHVDKDGKRVN